MSFDEHPGPARDWNRIGAIATITIGTATLLSMWWLDYRGRHPDVGVQIVAWWMPVLIAATIIISSILFYRASLLSRSKPNDLSGNGAVAEAKQKEFAFVKGEVKRLTNGVDLLQAKLTEEELRTNEKDQQLREEKANHHDTRQSLERCREDLRVQRIHTEEAQRELARLKLQNLTREQWNAAAAPKQPSVKVQFIAYKETYSIADEIERVFKPLGWYVLKVEANGSTLRNPSTCRVVIQSGANNLGGIIAGLFNLGKLITETAAGTDLLRDFLEEDLRDFDVVVTVFP
jgi:hypothetical protein